MRTRLISPSLSLSLFPLYLSLSISLTAISLDGTQSIRAPPLLGPSLLLLLLRLRLLPSSLPSSAIVRIRLRYSTHVYDTILLRNAINEYVTKRSAPDAQFPDLTSYAQREGKINPRAIWNRRLE